MNSLFFMGEYGHYVWPAIAVTAIVMIRLVIATALRTKNLNRQLSALEAAGEPAADHADET